MYITFAFSLKTLAVVVFLVDLLMPCNSQRYFGVQTEASHFELLSLLCTKRGQDALQVLNEMFISFRFSVETFTIFLYLVDSLRSCDSQGHFGVPAEAGRFELLSLLCPRRG